MSQYWTKILYIDESGIEHRLSHVEELARDRGIEILYLPAYSPDLNPTEHFWAHLKGYLRKKLPTASSALGEICRACRFFAEKRLNVE